MPMEAAALQVRLSPKSRSWQSLQHAVGTKAYSRLGLTTKSRHQKACAKYATSSDAQTAFLSKGGPKKDRLGLDPDGDGYACGWDPTPYRQAARN